jgi:hypothetical protein
MIAQTSSFSSEKQQLLANEAECRHMSILLSLAPARRMEFRRLADYWAQLAEAEAETP